MELVIRGRKVTQEDLVLIKSLIAEQGHRGRYFLSRELCRNWHWTQPNGALKDVACRDLLLRLEDKGLVKLPARQRGAIRGMRRSVGVYPLLLPEIATATPESITVPLEWRLANTGPEACLYKGLVDTHHYLGYRPEIGHFLRYVAYHADVPIATLGWAAAAQKVASRDRFIAWSCAQRLKRLHLVVNNTRFLVVPRIPHLASHLLASNIRRLAADWQARYSYAPVLLETFVDTERFKGTCYKAANWIFAGLTQGRGKYDRYTRRQETIKAVFLYPLRPDFRQVLCHG